MKDDNAKAKARQAFFPFIALYSPLPIDLLFVIAYYIYMINKENETMKIESKYGYVSYHEETDPVFDSECNEIGEKTYMLIDLVWVESEYRRQGYARKMLAEAIVEMEKTGLPIYLAALPKDDDVELDWLVSFYESAGFVANDEDQGGSAVIMEYYG